ncbi:MAG: hypothetical protein Q7T33_03140 [Dehalococcoidia bacterium]|nr:hypothetical protein [Dehalococcoidia bacterium]
MAVGRVPYGRPPFAGHWSQPLALAACAGFLGLILFAVVASGQVAVLLGLVAAAALAYTAWRWPMQTVIALMVLLPISRFLSFAAFTATDSTTVLRASQTWKDVVLAVLVIRMVHDAFLRRQAPRVHFLDLLVVFYILLVAAYVIYPGDEQQSSRTVRLLAFRQDAFYLLAYFVGRGLTISREHLRQMLLTLAGISVVIAAVAVWQWAAPGMSNKLFDKLGYSEFTEAVGTPHEAELVRSRLLAGGELPRASSLFLADLGLAFYQILLIPIAAGLFFSVRRGLSSLSSGFLLLLMIGTMGLTVARAPALAAIAGLALLILASRSFLRGTWTAVGLAAMALVFVLVSGFSPSQLSELFSSQESSALAHTELIRRSTELLQANPLGLGLGNGSHVSILANNVGTGSVPAWATETWYLQLGLEMGVAAIFLFCAILLGVTAAGLIASFHVRDQWLRALTLGVAGAGTGFILVGVFHPVWAAVQVAYIFWIFAGISVRAQQLDAEWDRTQEDSG